MKYSDFEKMQITHLFKTILKARRLKKDFPEDQALDMAISSSFYQIKQIEQTANERSK